MIWTRQHKVAKQIKKKDKEAGGQPEVWRFVARRCTHCRRWWLGSAAHFLRDFEGLAWLSGKPLQITRKNLLGDSENREGCAAFAHCQR